MTHGKWISLAILVLAVAMSASALWYLSRQGRRALQFWGAEHARRIVQAPQVELIVVDGSADDATGTQPAGPDRSQRRDISTARGLLNVRRGLVTDASFDWSDLAPTPSDRWDYLLSFRDETGETVVGFSLDEARVGRVDTGPAISTAPVARGLKQFLEEQAAGARGVRVQPSG
jgi:hypothetical protein